MSQDQNPVIAELKPIGILNHLSAEDLEALKYYGVFGEYGPGEIVVKEATDQDKLYVVVAGKLEVIVQHAGEEMVLGIIEAGDCIGEVSIFEPGQASATVRVMETSVLWYLDVNSLQGFFERMPVAAGQLMIGISQLLSKRLRQANQAIIANRILPKHLSVRSGKMQPIKLENIDKESDRTTGFLGLLKGKKLSSKIRSDIKTD